jgi:uncharacterized protein
MPGIMLEHSTEQPRLGHRLRALLVRRVTKRTALIAAIVLLGYAGYRVWFLPTDLRPGCDATNVPFCVERGGALVKEGGSAKDAAYPFLAFAAVRGSGPGRQLLRDLEAQTFWAGSKEMAKEHNRACRRGDQASCFSAARLGWAPTCESSFHCRRQNGGAEAKGYLGSACDGGDFAACSALADLFDHGRWTMEKDKPKAASLYQKACAGGAMSGCAGLAAMVQAGQGGLVRDDNRAVQLLQRACAGGEMRACAGLGVMYSMGRGGLARDDKRAVELLQTACDDKNVAGCSSLGAMYSMGRGGPSSDKKRVVELFNKACDGEEFAGCANLGIAYEHGLGDLAKDEKRAAELYGKACDGEDMGGCLNLGRMYEHGRGVGKKSDDSAGKQYQQACDGGELEGCCRLGIMHERGRGGLDGGRKRAVELYARACRGDDMCGCTHLTDAFEREQSGFAKDEVHAADLLGRACDGGDVVACGYLGVWYARGGGGLPKDEQRAVELYRRACIGGSMRACTSFGLAHETGFGGLVKDEKRAGELYQQACEGGCLRGCDNLGRMYENGLGGRNRDLNRAQAFYAQACGLGEGEDVACEHSSLLNGRLARAESEAAEIRAGPVVRKWKAMVRLGHRVLASHPEWGIKSDDSKLATFAAFCCALGTGTLRNECLSQVRQVAAQPNLSEHPLPSMEEIPCKTRPTQTNFLSTSPPTSPPRYFLGMRENEDANEQARRTSGTVAEQCPSAQIPFHICLKSSVLEAFCKSIGQELTRQACLSVVPCLYDRSRSLSREGGETDSRADHSEAEILPGWSARLRRWGPPRRADHSEAEILPGVTPPLRRTRAAAPGQ